MGEERLRLIVRIYDSRYKTIPYKYSDRVVAILQRYIRNTIRKACFKIKYLLLRNLWNCILYPWIEITSSLSQYALPQNKQPAIFRSNHFTKTSFFVAVNFPAVNL